MHGSVWYVSSFFFQAEDGIRDLVRSRGLGDVYKRQAWFCHIPGLKVVMPSCPADAKGLLRAAIHEDNPVIFIELKRLYNTKGPVPRGEYFIPLGTADVKRTGSHATVIATGAQVGEALKAAERLASEGIEVEVIDPRTLYPLDRMSLLHI